MPNAREGHDQEQIAEELRQGIHNKTLSPTFIQRAVPIAFNDDGLSEGKVVYTVPAGGAYLIDVVCEKDVAWDGTTPTGDLGYVGQDSGWWNSFAAESQMIDMATAWNDYWTDGKTFLGKQSDQLSAALILRGAGAYPYNESLPIKFAAGTEWIFWVTQNGFRGGADPGSEQGSGHVILTIGLPL